MQIIRIPALFDNYIFLLHDPQQNIAAVVDPAVAEPVLQQLQQLQAELVAIFNTHHHSDHIGGNHQLLQRFPNLCVYGGKEDRGRIPGQQVFLEEGDRVSFANRTAQVLFVPVPYPRPHRLLLPPEPPPNRANSSAAIPYLQADAVRLFEGTPAQMVDSLNKIRALPDSTRIWCAHEYTLKNLQFALTVDAENPDLKDRFIQVKQMRRQNESTIPSLLGIEKQTNPFLRWDRPSLQASTHSQDALQTFRRLRGMKDRF
uniref:Hydroxyacylglutathione hydrolase n=1 Tax=Desertifilum tharense IPPAS B-1220 TaxID=1781255 RepID=A0ACD5H1C9_9CYAN